MKFKKEREGGEKRKKERNCLLTLIFKKNHAL